MGPSQVGTGRVELGVVGLGGSVRVGSCQAGLGRVGAVRVRRPKLQLHNVVICSDKDFNAISILGLSQQASQQCFYDLGRHGTQN